MPFTLLAFAGFGLGALISRFRRTVWPSLASLAVGMALALLWYGAMLLAGYTRGDQDGQFILIMAFIAGSSCLVGAHALRLIVWLRRRSRRDEA